MEADDDHQARDRRVEALLEKGAFDDALALATERLERARAAGDDAALAVALIAEARAQLAHGDRDDAVMTVDEAISKARRSCGPSDVRYAEALELGGEIAAEAGMPNAADARFRAAIGILERTGVSDVHLANTLLHHGLFRRAEGDVVGALRALSEVVERAGRAADARRHVAMALTEMGFIALDGGRDAAARELGDRALEIFLALRQARRVEVADAMSLVGHAAFTQGEPATTVEFLEPACTIYQACKGAVGARHAEARHRLGLAYAATGRAAEARAALLAAIELYREGSPERLEIEQTLLDLARS